MATLTALADCTDLSNRKRRWIDTYTGPAAPAGYPAGGDPLLPGEVRMAVIEAVLGLIASNGAAVVFGWYDTTNQVIHWYTANAVEVVAGVDLSGYTATIEVIGH